MHTHAGFVHGQQVPKTELSKPQVNACIFWNELLLKYLTFSSFANILLSLQRAVTPCLVSLGGLSVVFLRSNPCKYNAQAKAQAQAA